MGYMQAGCTNHWTGLAAINAYMSLCMSAKHELCAIRLYICIYQLVHIGVNVRFDFGCMHARKHAYVIILHTQTKTHTTQNN
jgi:hypothetical protein